MNHPQIAQITQISFLSWVGRKSKGPTVRSERGYLAEALYSIFNQNLRNLSNLRMFNFGFSFQ